MDEAMQRLGWCCKWAYIREHINVDDEWLAEQTGINERNIRFWKVKYRLGRIACESFNGPSRELRQYLGKVECIACPSGSPSIAARPSGPSSKLIAVEHLGQ